MTVEEVLTWIQGSALAHAISKSNHMVGAGLQILHIIGFVLLLASLLLLSLRLLGFVFVRQPVAQVADDATRLIWIGLALAVFSGTLMFVSTPRLYFHNWAFQLKMALLVVAILIQLLLFRRVARAQSPSPARVWTSVVLTLVAWFGISLAGRMIGFI
jgi:hypothetical protein